MKLQGGRVVVVVFVKQVGFKPAVKENTNRKSYVAYQMALLPMPLNDLEVQFSV